MLKYSLSLTGQTLGIAVSLSAAFIFGLYPPAARAAYQDGANPVFMMLLTTLMRAGAMVAFCVLKHRPLFATAADRRIAFSGGFFQSLSIIGIIASLAYLPGPVMIMVVFSHTIMLLLFMMLRREMPFNAQTIFITLTSVGGLSLVVDVWNPRNNNFHHVGLALAFMAALATTSRLYIYGQLTKTRDPIVVGAEAFTCCCGLLLIVPFFSIPVLPASLAGWGWTLVAGLSLTLGTFCMFYAIAILGAFKQSMFAKTEPVFNALFSALILGEILNATQYVGMAVVIGSLFIYQFQQRRLG